MWNNNNKTGIFINIHTGILILITGFLLLTNNVLAQQKKDTLQFSKELKDAGNIKDSYKLLKIYLKDHPKEFNAIWFSAKLAYWNWDIDNAKQYYQTALTQQPKNYYLKLDYAMMLVELGNFDEAIGHLHQYIKYDSLSKEAQLYLAKAYYWQGNTTAALNTLNNVPATLKNNESVKNLRHEIALVRAINLNIKAGYDVDDQPMKHFSSGVEISKNESNLCNWYIGTKIHFFNSDTSSTNAYHYYLGNKFTFYNLGMQINTHLGATTLPYANSTEFTGGIAINKKLFKGFSLLLDAERKPYFFTIKSSQTKVLQSIVTGVVSIDNFKGFTGKLQYQQQMFDEGNIHAVSAWLLTPALKWNKFSIKAGYSYQNSDADNNNYSSTKSLDSIIAHPTTAIKGVYLPYFTPKSQTIHSALLWLNYKPTGSWNITASTNIAVNASLQNPYLFLNKNTNNVTIIDKGYSSLNYSPIDINLKLQYNISERVSALANYAYQKTNFYSGHFIDATIHILLLNEHKH